VWSSSCEDQGDGVGRAWAEEASALSNGYIVSFSPFHECGLAIPPHLFLWGLLHHYQIEL
jgi:hypothetical protein